MNWQRLFTLVLFELRHAVFRLKGLVFLIPFSLFWYWILKLLIDQGTDFLVSKESFAITAFLFDMETAQSLLLLNPPSLSVFLILSIATMPFFVMLAGNNQLASDAGAQTFRYLLTRCTRLELFFSRFICAYILMAGTIIIVGGITTIISLKHDQYDLPETMQYAQQVILLTLLYALPFFAYMSAISAFMSSALGTLLMSIVIYIALLILTYYLSIAFSFLPSALKDDLLVISTDNITIVLIGLLAYSLIYISLGWLIFSRRNL